MVVIVIPILFHAIGGENKMRNEKCYNGGMHAKVTSYLNDWGVKDKANDYPLVVKH